MDDRLAMIALRDMLRAQLVDPLTQYSSTSRQWIHNDTILPTATFPRIQLEKIDDSRIENLSIGFKFWEKRILPVNIWFKTKTNFKYKVDDNYLTNEEFTKYYQEEIKDIIKDHGQFFHDNYRIYVKVIAIGSPVQDEESQLYYGKVTVNIICYET